ncbi:MAG: molybdenum cofactor guanylyltransferase [Methanobacterium sp.]|uniref:molybdenum cofactor guanylyltransferase n=1 Tax=Methanobacterium sp. TaxID=2164 RepID=UPI003D654479|nr:molybdenum cofactor guanylyltransferase [Methanobacterium sp.]
MKSIIILCGGKSQRMGKDKGSLLLNKKPMVLHVLNAIKDIADEIILVLRENTQVEKYKNLLKNENIQLKIVTDKIESQGPLVGILTGLLNIKSEYAQILPCDSPFISKNFVLKMFEIIESNDFDAVVPIWNDEHIEPLHSIYKKNVIEIIEDSLKNERRDVNSLINSLKIKFVDVNELDQTTQSFQNINTINEFENI